jgi:hypothetical protein
MNGICILLLWIGLIAAAVYAAPTVQLIQADTASTLFRGFEPLEQSGDQRYRWTRGNAAIAIPAYPSVSGLIVDLEMTGPQWPGVIPANLNIMLDQGPAIQLVIPPAWRHYRLLLPRGAIGWGVPLIHLTGSTQSPGTGDSRSLGVALTQVGIVSVPDLFSRAALERGTFLLTLVLAFGSIVLFASSLKWSLILTSVVGIVIGVGQWLFPGILDTLIPVDQQIGIFVALVGIGPLLLGMYGKLLAQGVAGIAFALVGLLLVSGRDWVPLGILLLVGGGVLITIAIATWYDREQRTAVVGVGQRWPIWVAGAALGSALCLLFTANLGTFDLIHPDELFWMPTGRHAFQLFFIDHQYSDPFWYDFGNYFLAYHPQIGKFLIGASIAAAGIPEIPFQGLDWSQSIAWNIQHGFHLNPAALLAARLPVAIMAVVACLALYWLNVMVASWWQGLLAAVWLASNSAMLTLGRWAMLDVPALCFSLLTIALVVRVVQALRSGQNSLGWATLAGVMCGLAVSSKLIAVILVGPAFLALLYEAVRYRWKRVGSLAGVLASLSLMIGWSALIVYIANPLLYTQPIAGTLQMLEFVRLVQQTTIYAPTATLTERVLAVMASPAAFGMLSRIGLPIDQILVLVGCLAIGIDVWRIPALRQQRPLDIVVIWMLGSTLIITLSLPANIDRYLLPLQPIAAFLQAYGTIWVARRAVMLVHKRFGSVPTTNAPNTY